MLFSGITFLYGFLPLTLALYFLTPMRKGSLRLRNAVLLGLSLLFYACGEPKLLLLLLGQCCLAWAGGLAIAKWRGGLAGQLLFGLCCALSLLPLLFFKYADFALENLALAPLRLALPLGISFYTFQILSYLIDLRRAEVPAQRNFLDFALYIALFPQLIAGPIVRYTDIAGALTQRQHSLELFARGAQRFLLGLGKKVLLANSFAQLVQLSRGKDDALSAWLYLAAFTLQIYFDFSGYSDMAIGLGRIFGFGFPENFDYPYTSRSISEFWRRWHISLGRWFRDYVYIPLGGNRVKPARFVMNILVVWALTGFWHGADWNFFLWGLYYGLLLLLEKWLLPKLRLPGAVRRILTLLLVTLGFVLFDSSELSAAAGVLRALFGLAGGTSAAALYYLRSYGPLLAVGILGATPLPARLAEKLRLAAPRLFVGLTAAVLAGLLAAVTAYLVDGSFNPFIYFRF